MRVISRKVILAAAIASSLGVGVPLQAADVTPPPPTNAVTSSAALPPIASREGPVTVTVTPRNLAPGSTTWEFGVVLDTHSQPLSEDVAKSATLVDAHGGRHAALGWEGAATGGHHREGTLKFEPLAPDTDTVKLEITGVGGFALRTFEWRLK